MNPGSSKKHSDPICDVSDTALWVAYYRAVESERTDALFQDPFAKILAGSRGEVIAKSMNQTSRYVLWSLAIRTHVIDQFIENLVKEGFDTILNLGAGLDARPYRMNLPAKIKWIEVDYPHLLTYKAEKLVLAKPVCQLQRMPALSLIHAN